MKIKIIFSLIVVALLISCTGKRYINEPNIAFLKEENRRIFLCRITSTGTTICESSIDYFGNERLLVIPIKNWSLKKK